MVDRSEFARWRDATTDARRSAGLQREAGLHQWACFMAEQSAQLAIKGLLHGLGRPAWGHDLVALADAVASATETDVPAHVLAAVRRLSRHYIPTRYPDAHPSGPPGTHYGVEDSDQAPQDLSVVTGFVDRCWEAHRDE